MLSMLSGLWYGSDPVESWGQKLRTHLISGATSQQTIQTAAFEGFRILQQKLLSNVEQITLLNSVKVFQDVSWLSEGQAATINKLCPGVLAAPFAQRPVLIEAALAPLATEENKCYRKIIEWTFLQIDISTLKKEDIYRMIHQVSGALISNNKTINSDPLIPLFKIALGERVRWHLKNSANIPKLPQLIAHETDLIFKQIDEMYYNTFLGAGHPKVQENLRNQNDLVKITPQDVRDHIVHLQQTAADEVLRKAPAAPAVSHDVDLTIKSTGSSEDLSQ